MDLFGGVFTIVPVLFGLFFLIIVGGIVFAIGKSLSEAASNAVSPQVAIPATVVAKRTHIVSEHTHYYVTFEKADGERQEVRMTGPSYGLLVEHDQGVLRMQGTEYLGFDRA